MTEILEIACDEAGHTGPDLLQKDQRMFAFSSVSISDDEAYQIIAKARADFPVQMPELKASKLLASERGSEDGTEHPFESILRFAYGYRDIITADNARLDTVLPDQGRWTLDLSASGLWSHLNHWGRTGKLLSVRCDDSKPLRSIADQFTGDDNDPGIHRAAKMKRSPEPLGWKLAQPVAFVDSRSHPSVQIADVIAGTTMTIFAKGLPGAQAIIDSVSRHGHPHSILPDMDYIDLKNRAAAVNALIAYDLAKRAERQGDPYENLAAMYHLAEVSWTRGDFPVTGGRPAGS